MSNKPTESNSKKPTAISKQVLKANPIPQSVQTTAAIQKVNFPDNLPKTKPNQPLRSTKVSQKLVVFPNESAEPSSPSPFVEPVWSSEGVRLPIEWDFSSRTTAERMTKDERELELLPRAAAYYTGEGYDLNRARPFLRQHHRVSPRLYDECLYVPYHFPLLTLRPGRENIHQIRVQSYVPFGGDDFLEEEEEEEEREGDMFGEDKINKVVDQVREPFKGGEVFLFDYGVVVFWNFRRAEELLLLEDLMRFSLDSFRDNPDEELQIEELHFEYDKTQTKPRIFNDMITLKTDNPMIKLTLSHGLAQSAVLARYEEIMDKTIEDTKTLPKEMAETGRLGKNRTEITKINGQLFNLRMNVNLVSNVLDVPEIFWSEPALQPMYTAIREYLEIHQRAKILNDRLRVISDLLSMLRDHLNNFGVEYQTLIIIYLIIIAVIVACVEITVKILYFIDVI